jgi:hypothetical protein
MGASQEPSSSRSDKSPGEKLLRLGLSRRPAHWVQTGNSPTLEQTILKFLAGKRDDELAFLEKYPESFLKYVEDVERGLSNAHEQVHVEERTILKYSSDVRRFKNWSDIHLYLASEGGVPEHISAKLAEVIWGGVNVALVESAPVFIDPITKLEFPPKAPPVDYRRRPNDAAGERMGFAEYMFNVDVGWGSYTLRTAMASFWLMEMDKPAYNAGLYLAEKEADAMGLAPKSPSRSQAIDAFFLRHGVLTTTHLTAPSPEYQWQAQVISYARKLQGKIHRGNKTLDELHRGT